MNNQYFGFATKAAAGLLVTLSAFSACAEQVIIYTYQGHALTTERDSTGRSDFGSPPRDKQIDKPGVAFSLVVDQPIQAGQKISLTNFTGVMGQNGSFEWWDFLACPFETCYKSTSVLGDSKDSISYYIGHGDVTSFNENTPGVWSHQATTISADNRDKYDSYYHFYTNTAYVVEWAPPVPEADAGLMAVLGVAAVGTLARRKARTA